MNVRVKTAGIYTRLLPKTTCGHKPGPGDYSPFIQAVGGGEDAKRTELVENLARAQLPNPVNSHPGADSFSFGVSTAVEC